jgi:hypothetical protein
VKLDGTTVSPVGNGGGAPSAAAGVRVNATKSVTTYFAGVIGYPTIQVTATGSAAYSALTTVPLNWKISGIPIMPIAFGQDAYVNCVRNKDAFNQDITFSAPIYFPSDCTVDDTAHFGFSMLNLGNDCSNNTTKTLLDNLVNHPENLGDASVSVGTPIYVCQGIRDTTWDYIMSVGRPFLVPIVKEDDALACNPNCGNARIIGFEYMVATQKYGNGAATYLRGRWVDPATMPPVKGTTLSSTPGTASSAVTGAILFR